MADDPPFLSVGTEVSAKYKGAFCEAKIRKVVKTVKCKVLFKQGLGMVTVLDDAIKGIIRVGSNVEARHPEKKEFIEGTITKIQDCSQYTVVFDDGDITTLRRTALCLKSGRHFAESETLDQLPLTHPEHFGNPVIGGRRGRRRGGESSDEEEASPKTKAPKEEKEADIGRVVCVEGDKKKQRDNWFPGLVVAPTAQDTVRIHVRDEYLVRSFKDGRYYTVPKKETTEFTREAGAKVDNHSVKAAVEKALLFLDKDELPPHWDRDSLFGLNEPSNYESDHDSDSDNPDDEPREEKDHFVAQLYKFMDDRGTPINQGPTICSKDVDLYRLFYVVHNLGGYNRVTNHNHWKVVSRKLGYGQSPVNVNLVKHVYKRFLHSFEEFYRKLGCTMVNNPRTYRNNRRAGRSIIREKDRLAAKADKDRSDADESEEASVAGSLGTLQDVQDIKIEIDEPPPEIVPIVKVKVEPKEEPEKLEKKEPKKAAEKEKVVVKVKEEKKKIKEEDDKDEEIKVKTEPKEKSRIRQSKVKPAETTPPPPTLKKEKEIKKEIDEKEENKTTVVVEKKKRLFTRGLMKEKEKLGVNKPGLSPGLAATRQKRAIKDRVKAIVDRFKFRLTKDSSSVTSDSGDKSQNSNKEKPVKEKKEEKEIVAATPAIKKKEEPVKEEIKVISEEKKKVGRKKKERKEFDDTENPPTYKTVCVGDKLKVYYGPTNESKVTYEAKVISIKNDGPEVMYLVHYTGWNTRYDEYIKHSRIADNLSWVPGRTGKRAVLSFLKPGRRKNSVSKPETGNKSDGPPGSKIECKGDGPGINSAKADSPNSKASSPGDTNLQSKSQGKSITVTRSSSRNSNKKEYFMADVETEDECDTSMPKIYWSEESLSDKTTSEKIKEVSKPENSNNKPEDTVSSKTENKDEGGGITKIDSPIAKTSSPGESTLQAKSQPQGKSVAVTRSSSRNSNKKEYFLPDVETEDENDIPIPKLYWSDDLLSDKTPSEKVKEILGINDVSSLVNLSERRKTKRRIGGEDVNKGKTTPKHDLKGKDDSANRDESTPSPKIDKRKKRSQSESENQESKEKKRQYTRRRRSSSTTEDKSDSVSVEPESVSSGDDKKRTRKRSSGLESIESNSPQKKRRLLSEKKSEISPGESNSQQSMSTDEESSLKATDQDTEDASKGRDFDLIQIRSELKGLDKAVKNEADSFKSITTETKASDKKTETEKLAEDIYEFKEPEPFEFEVRKSSEDKGKSLQRRPLGRLFDDSKKQQAILLPNMYYKGKKESKPEEPKKSFLNSIYSFKEDNFDKVNLSPRRPVVEDAGSSPSKPFQLFSELPDEETDQQNIKDTQNPLNVTYTISKDETIETACSKSDGAASPAPSNSPKSNSHTDIEFNENSNMDSNEVESTSKSCFSRDDDDDEMEDESINFAIQRAIKQEISDDDDTNHHSPSTLIKTNIFPSQLDKIPDKPVLVESVSTHEQDDLESCPILEKHEESEEKCDDRSSEGIESDDESENVLQEEEEVEKEEKEESVKDEEESEEEAETTVIESSIVVNSAVVADNVVIAGEELVSTSSIITPIVIPNDSKETTIEFSTDLSEEDQIAKAIFSLSSSPVIHKPEEQIIQPIAATVQVETNDSDLSDSEERESVKEIPEEPVKSEREFSFKAITVPPPDDSESTLSIPYTENKNNDELIINLEPLKPEKEITRTDNEENTRIDLNLDSLLCEETIPGSPGCGEESDEKIASEQLLSLESKIERIEEVMGQPIVEEIVSTESSSQVVTQISPGSSPNDSLPVESNTSPPQVSSYLPSAQNQYSEPKDSDDDSKMDKTPSKQETLRRSGSSTLKRSKPGKKRHNETVKRRQYRSRQNGSESDDTSENSTSANIAYNRASMSSTNMDSSSSDNVKSFSKYNFLVPLDPSMDQNTKITLIQNSIQQIRKVYADLKSELAVIDRRRKKLRKRERESLAAARLH